MDAVASLAGDLPDTFGLGLIVLGALFAGLVTGLAGFGTGLVASGLWLHVIAPTSVPPLVLLVSLGGQLFALRYLRLADAIGSPAKFARPLVVGGAVGLIPGVFLLITVDPSAVRASIAVLMIAYAVWQLAGPTGLRLGRFDGNGAEFAAGFAGGFLGGFAGIPGPVPLIFLQLRAAPRDAQRAAYLAFSLVMLSVGVTAMTLSGVLDVTVALLAAISLPATLAGSWLGARVYLGVSEAAFRRIIACLLLFGGAVLILRPA